MKQLLNCIFLSALFISCVSANHSLVTGTEKFDYKDRTGSFVLEKKHKHLPNKKRYVVMNSLKEKKVELESSIMVYTPGVLKDVHLLRPDISQFKIWFDGKPYASQIKLNTKTKKIDVLLRSPEEKWNGTKSYDVPTGTGAICYLGSLFECVKYTGFFEQAVDKEAGQMNLQILFEGFPYFNDSNFKLPLTPIVDASVRYDGLLEDKYYRFVLDLEDQMMFFLVDKEFNLSAQIWVAQGTTIERIK